MNNELFAIGRDKEGVCQIAICFDEDDFAEWGKKKDLILAFHTGKENAVEIKKNIDYQINAYRHLKSPIAVFESFAIEYNEAVVVSELLNDINKFNAPIEWSLVPSTSPLS